MTGATMESARHAFAEACARAQAATASGRFDKAAAYLNQAAMHYQELNRMRAAIEAMKGKNNG
jgi:hypothetical protein